MSIEFDSIYFDLESYSPGNRPHFIDTIIIIGYTQVDGRLILLKSWEKTEKVVLDEFYQYLKYMAGTRPRRKLIGHNILGFDIPLFVSRATEYKIDKIEVLFDVVSSLEIVDLLQCLLPYNRFYCRGLNADNLSRIFNLSPIIYSGKDISRLYENKEFGAIEEHLQSDIEFNQSLSAILRTVPAKELSMKLAGLR